MHRYMYQRFLEQQREVVEAPNADAGLAACDDAAPDCIVVDYRLPDVNGLDLLPASRAKTMRRSSSSPRIPTR